MTQLEKLKMTKMLLGINESDTSENARILAFLSAAEKEILSWRYSLSSQKVNSVPTEYEMTQVYAVIA